MLNEKREFDLYLTSGYGGIVFNDTLKDSLSGIRHLFTVLARGFLEVCRENGITEKGERHALTTAFLKTWALGTWEADQTLPAALHRLFERAAAASLSRYLADNQLPIPVKDRLKDWEGSLFETSKNNSIKENLNAVRFKCIVADALIQGPLKNEKLVLRDSASEGFGLQGDFTQRHTEQLLSIVALYLQSKPSDCVSVVLPLANLSHYLHKPTNKGKDSPYQSVSSFINKAGYAYEGRLLFHLTHPTNGCSKLAVDAKWLTDWDVHLIPADAAIPDGYTCYDDNRLRPC